MQNHRNKSGGNSEEGDRDEPSEMHREVQCDRAAWSLPAEVNLEAPVTVGEELEGER